MVKVVQDFRYPGSFVTKNDGSSDKDCQTRIGKANSVLGRLKSWSGRIHISFWHWKWDKWDCMSHYFVNNAACTCWLRQLSVTRKKKQELSYRKQIARQLRTQYVEGIHRPKYYTVTLKCGLKVTRGHWKWYHLKAWVRFPIRLP